MPEPIVTPDPPSPTGDPIVPPAGGPEDKTDYKALYETARTEAETLKKVVADLEPYKGRFAGMQGAYTKESEAWKRDAAALAEITTAKTALETQFAEAQEKLDTAMTEAEVIKATNDKFTVVIAEFPELIPFMDLLPDATGDELKQKLQVFTKRLSQVGTLAVADFTKGATPPAPNEKPTGTKEELLKQLNAAAASGNKEEYDKAYAAYLAATSVVS
jgi:hypothetical protein